MTENKIQQQIYIWYNNNYCLKKHEPQNVIFSVPNGGFRNSKEAMMLQATGLLAGVSDLIILHGNKTIFVEVKTSVGIQSQKQKEFQIKVSKLGYDYYLVRCLEEFKVIINTKK